VHDASAYSVPWRCAVHFADCKTCAASWYKVESNVDLDLAAIPRNLQISKHTGETNHLQYFDNALKPWPPPCGPCGLCELFPNICIILRIFLAIPATVASAERFFSKLKLVKNYLRSAMSQTRLVDLAILNIEPSIARQLDFDSVIRNFANKNTKKSHI